MQVSTRRRAATPRRRPWRRAARAWSLYCTILYFTVLYYTVLYYTILYCTILYYTILCYTILYCTILQHTMEPLLQVDLPLRTTRAARSASGRSSADNKQH